MGFLSGGPRPDEALLRPRLYADFRDWGTYRDPLGGKKAGRFWSRMSDASDGSVTGGIFNLEYNPDGSILAAACEKKSVLLFDPGSRKVVKSLEKAHLDCVNCVR